MHIRILTENDAETYKALRLQGLQTDPHAFRTLYETYLPTPIEQVRERLRPTSNPPEKFCLGAFTNDNTLVGNVFFEREQMLKVRHKGNILGMYVAPQARGQGVGKALLQQLIAQATLLPGLEQIGLTVVANNTPARALYHSLGFETYGLERRAMKLGEQYWDEELMVLYLNATTT